MDRKDFLVTVSKFLADLEGVNVTCAGDAFLDVYCDTQVRTSETEDDVQINEVIATSNQIGGAGTVSRICSALGLKTTFFGVVGQDKASGFVENIASELPGVTPVLYKSPTRKTSTKTRYRQDNSVVFRADDESVVSLPNDEAAAAGKVLQNLSGSSDLVLIADYGKGLHPVWSRSQKNWIPPDDLFLGADTRASADNLPARLTVLKKNRIEWIDFKRNLASAETELVDGDEMAYLKQKLGIDYLLVTEDVDGMRCSSMNHPEQSVPTFARRIVTEISAGNAAFVLFSLAVKMNLPLNIALAIASCGAACTLENLGSGVFSSSELLSFIEDSDHEVLDNFLKTAS